GNLSAVQTADAPRHTAAVRTAHPAPERRFGVRIRPEPQTAAVHSSLAPDRPYSRRSTAKDRWLAPPRTERQSTSRLPSKPRSTASPASPTHLRSAALASHRRGS